MKWLFPVTLLGVSALPSWGWFTPEAPKPESSSPQASASSSKIQNSHKRGHSSKGKRSARKRGPSYQLHPDPERYQEIQKALAERGYFKGEANGQWGDDSVEALKRFQADQKLPDDGKINSLSLIGLGLGPKHDGASVTPAAGAASPAVQPPPLPDSAAPPTSEELPR
ncbi:MAG: peptidoglycan-binding domain-containing protein [Bryobacteraceae bacterium]